MDSLLLKIRAFTPEEILIIRNMYMYIVIIAKFAGVVS